jgi:hypothetical protein
LERWNEGSAGSQGVWWEICATSGLTFPNFAAG